MTVFLQAKRMWLPDRGVLVVWRGGKHPRNRRRDDWFSIVKRVVGEDGWVLVCVSAEASAEAVRRKGTFCNGNVVVLGWVLGFLGPPGGASTRLMHDNDTFHNGKPIDLGRVLGFLLFF